MKKNMPGVIKRFLSLLLCLSMVLPLVPLQLPAKAAVNQSTSGSWEWEAVSDSARDIYLTAVNENADMSTELVYDCGHSLSNEGETSYMTIVEGGTADNFSVFVAALTAAKFTLKSERTIASNTSGASNAFADFLSPDGKYKLYTYYLPAYSEIRIIVDSQVDTVQGYQYTPQTGKTVEPKVVLWGLPQAPDGHNVGDALNAVNMVNYGAMTVILMPDNSLFIHDGGDLEQWSDEGCADFLAFCRKLTGTTTEKMVINTWAISHAHHDHFKGFWRFLYKNHTQFDLKNVMYNIDRERTGDKYDITGAMKLVREVYPEARYYKPHTGEKINIAGVTLDILYTQEDRFVPDADNNLAIDDDDLMGGTYRTGLLDSTTQAANFNDTSTVMKFTFNPGASNETDALLYADLTNATAILMAVYAGSVLSADIVSVPHHGQNDQTALMTLAKNGGAKVFFQYQHKGLAYGGDNDLTKQDMFGTFVTKVRDNFKAMFPEMNYAPGSETANYQVFWAGVNTVTVDMNKLSATTSPRTATNYYASEPALTYEYTGWDVMDDTDYLISTRTPHTNTTATVMGNTPDFNLELVTNEKLLSNERYIIRKKGSDFVMSYTAVATTPGTPNRATSLKVVHLPSDKNDPNYDASDPGPVIYSPDGKTTLYMNHSYRDQTLWILTQQKKGEAGAVADKTQVAAYGTYSALFGGTAFTNVYLWKGADNGKYWNTPNGQDGNDPATQYRYMYLKNWNSGDENGSAAKSGRNWMTTSITGLQEDANNTDLRRYVVEHLGGGDYLIYWRNKAGTRVHFLACDEYGNWGEKIYTTEYENDLYPDVPKVTTAEGAAEIAKLTVNFYHYNEFSTGGTSANTRNLMFTGVKDYNVEQGITKDQVARIIEENIKLWQYEDDRRNLPVPCSGWEPKVGYYHLDLKVPTFDTSGNSYSQFDVDIRYVQDGKAGQQEAKSFATVTFYLYERKLSLAGTQTYTVPMGTSEGELRNLIINGDPSNTNITPISVTQSFANVKGTMSQYMDTVWQPANVPYSAIPEAGKYYLEFVPSSNGSVTYLVNVKYRRAGGADILVDTLSIIEDIEFVLPEMPEGVEVLEGFVAKNAGVAATVFDAEGNPITFQVNGQEVELTLGMICDANGRFVDTSKEATYTDLIVKYRGQQVKGGEDDKALTITLNVTISDIAQEKPKEGEPGYVGPNKKVASSESEFLEDGVGSVQLSAYGIPFEKGVDIILVLDLSGSMRYGMDTNTHAPNYEDSRMYNMEQSLQELLKTLQKSGADVRVAMSDFGDLDHYEFDGAVIDTTIKKDQFFDANYSGAKYTNTYEFSNHLNYIFAKDGSPLADETERQDKPFGQSLHIFNKASHRYTGSLDPHIYTGSGEVGVEAFVDVSTLYNGNKFTSDMGTIIKQLDENVQKGIGTNYDVGLEYAYHLGYAIRQDNIAKGEDREIICIFMSDGAPMQYNYFTGHSNSQAWAEWITGTVEEVAAEKGKDTAIQTITYTETGNNAPIGLSQMKTDVLNLLKNGQLVRPEYQREYWTGWVYNEKDHAEAEDTNNRTRAYDLTNGYFLYRERYADDSAVTFFDFMNAQGHELDWDYLCRIAWANGIPEFDYEYYQKNPNLPELVDLLTKGADGGVAKYLGYERVAIKDDAGKVTKYEYYKVRRSRLIDPGLSEQQYFPQYTGTSSDVFAAFKSLGIEDSWDYFTQVAYKNRDNLSTFIAKMKNTNSSISNGQEAMTEFVNLMYTKNFSSSSYWATFSPYAYFYNKDGKNWWAEAIKGDPTKLYPVINKYAESGDSPHPYNGDASEFDITGDGVNDRYISGFQGLGIDIYGILFASAGDGETDSDSSNDDNEDASAAAASGGTNKGGTWDKLLYVPPIMRAISSNNGSASGNYYFLASNQEQLTNAFKSIAGTMSEAATKAYYTDTIGKNYDLFYGQVESTKTPAIKVMHYNLDHEAMRQRLEEKKDPNYKPEEGEKEEPTIRVGEPTVMETITFKTDANGKLIEAYSDLIDNGKTNILLENGLIQGRYVLYNTNTEADKSIDLYLDDTGKAFPLKPETFFWIIGNIGATEVVLDYQVYLLGSMDNTLNTQGATQYFDTNEEATLNYVDNLGNDTKYEFEKSPFYPWLTVQANSMNVSKSVEKTNASDKFKLTLEAFGTGTTVANAVSNPLDIVLVLDQSASMYTPAGIDAESISISNMTQVRQQLSGKAISFNASNKTIQENAKNLGYYVAVHNTSNYIYIVQYAEYAEGKWGWFYIPVDETTRTVELNTKITYTDTDDALVLGKKNGVYQPYGYGTYAQSSKAALTNVSYYKTQYGELYDTLQDFVTELKDVSVSSGLDHRVAVVGFASPYYDQIPGSEGTGIYVNGEYNIFKNTADEFYSTALVDVRENYDSVLNSVKAYKANYQQTCPSIGITIAQSIFGARKTTDGLFTTPAINDKLNPASPTVGYDYAEDQADEHLKSTYTEDNDENRDEIIILFTDGMPTVRCSSVREMGESKNHAVKAEFWSEAGGLDDVIDHAYDAKQAGIEIYCIGTSDAVINQAGLKSISSDDPTAQSKLTITETWVNDSQGNPYVSGATASAQIMGSTYDDRGYTMYTSDANMDLSKAFDTVYESIIDTVELTETAVVKEVVSDYFDLTSVDPKDIKVYTVDYLGNYESGQYKFSETRTLLENAQVTITSSDESDRLDTILVSGFSYKNQYVGMVDQKPVGKKLIIELEIQVKDEFWGGKNVPTNEGTTGVYTPEGVPVIYFPIPETNVQFKNLVQPDTVVVDYGLPVSIDVAGNDTVSDKAKATSTGILSAENQRPEMSLQHNELFVDEVRTEHGIMTTQENGMLHYAPINMSMDQLDSFIYEMEFKAQKDSNLIYGVEGNTLYQYADVTVIPASSIYYEDNFVGFSTYTYDESYNVLQVQSGGWTQVSEALDRVQAQDHPGADLLNKIDANNVYGYDQAYADMTTYSNGSAQKIRVYDGLSGVASFTFTGTGFDVIGLTSNTTGTITVGVTNSKGEFVAGYMVDSYYGYSFVDGQWVANPNAANSLYQVPVIKVDLSKIMTVPDDPDTDEDETQYISYGYDTYTVEIDASYAGVLDHGQCQCDDGKCTGCYEFYLDAIRVYNPAGFGGSNSQQIQDAYVQDGEGWPVYQELRNMFITQKNLGATDTEGVIFIDGKDQPEISDYRSWGPNNEVYLAPGQSIAFTLNALNYVKSFEQGTFDEDLIASIQLGMRGINALGQVTVKAADAQDLNFRLSATDLFYDVTSMMNKVVTITNNGDSAIAISSFKITHTEDPTNGDAEGSGVMSLRGLPTVSLDAAKTALEILTPEQLTDPVLKPKYPALSFEGMVCYNVFFTAEELGDLNEADLGLAVFDSYQPEGTVETAKDVILGATQIDGLYMVETNGVHAKYLGDTQYFRAFAKKADGSYVYSKMVSYSALDYAKNVLEKSSDVKLKQLVVAMLNYGAEAQKFFGYNTEDLMNKDLTAEQQALVSGIDAGALNAVGKVDASKVGMFASNGGFAKKYPAISFKGAFEINYFMAPSNAVDGEMTLFCWNEDTYNSATELTAENADKVVTMTLENGLYTASSDQIAAKDLDKTVYVAAVYESNGVSYCSGVLPYSIAAYCQKPPADVAALANAAAVYGCTAKEFFGA